VKSLGIYIHIPFCKSKCAYCDFYSCVGNKNQFLLYTKALCEHISEGSMKKSDYEIDSIYFGGGTPTVIGEKNLLKIVNTLYRSFNVLHECETTIETNPNTVTLPMLKKLQRAGFNRISIGAQSSNPFELSELGRTHTFDQVTNAVNAARAAKIENISLDLMYGIPNQSLNSWLNTLEDVIALNPSHISCYALKVEPDTPMFNNAASYHLPDEDTQADMYLKAVRRLAEAGYEQYEISNFAKPGFECKHNLKYWSLEEYWGFGPGAHSFVDKMRFSYLRDTDSYINGVLQHGVIIDKSETCNASERGGEYLMLMLRTKYGISSKVLERKYLTYFDEIEKCLLKYHRQGLCEFDGSRWYLTPRGFLVSNTIISDVLAALEKSRGVVNRII
jgi:putative oxygen-independent coproporphyrinogen III oxidase